MEINHLGFPKTKIDALLSGLFLENPISHYIAMIFGSKQPK